MANYKLKYTGDEIDTLLDKVATISDNPGGGSSGGTVNCPFEGDITEAANMAINAYAKQITEETIDEALKALY